MQDLCVMMDLTAYVDRTLTELQTKVTGGMIHRAAGHRQAVLSLWQLHQEGLVDEQEVLDVLREAREFLVRLIRARPVDNAPRYPRREIRWERPAT